MDCQTSDFYKTCVLPERFANPDLLNGYGCQYPRRHPFYITTNMEYGFNRPSVHTVPQCYYPKRNAFTKSLPGITKNYKLNM
ncbi:unnamed protein product [Nezara viridula]|uniref:Uncharacterized protein n=1 Tax=Nezara viridula TaxID=85310 RepID=A0A9P0H2M0_NEZVI|nr:unnamed protein product [Nezara viridula]